MLTLSQDEIDALDSDTQRMGVLFRLATDPIARWWLGVGDCEAGVNAYDETASNYQGLGQLLDVPAFQQLINGVAERVLLRVEGVSARTIALASDESQNVKGAAQALGFVLFGGDWRQLGIPKWLWAGKADFVTLNQQSDGARTTRTIELSIGSLFTSRRRRAYSYLTDQDQQSRHPGDLFCQRTVHYAQDTDKVWPTF